jgi:hypothetical protein
LKNGNRLLVISLFEFEMFEKVFYVIQHDRYLVSMKYLWLYYEEEWTCSSTLSLTSTLGMGGLLTTHNGRFTPGGDRPVIHSGSISPHPSSKPRPSDRPARSESLYRLRARPPSVAPLLFDSMCWKWKVHGF